MTRMRKPTIYLCGRMGKDPYHRQWRKDITPFLEDLGFEVLDPYVFEPLQLKGLRPGRLPEGFSHWYELQDSEEHEERFDRYMRHIIRYDLNLVRTGVDYIIVYWDKGCKDGCGTHAEISDGFMANIPIYCVKSAKMPGWAFSCCSKRFNEFEDLREFLQDEFGNGEKKD